MLQNVRRASFLWVAAIAAGLSAPADAAPERAILVLDSSGSMWGQVGGVPKISVARNVIKGLLGDWNPNVELGVTAYGHREKGNCADIEALVPVGPVDGQQVMAAIETLKPKGKTPLTEAVRQAAETLKYTEERATVLLVSDGKETCDADPCAAAAELDANGVDFTVHVVGFDLTDEEKAQLHCIADNTGGKFLSADSAPELHQAMATTVQLVAEAKPAPKPQQVASGPTGLKLSAALTEGGEPVDVRFDIFRAEQDIDGKRELVKRLNGKSNKPAIIELAPGRYFVTAVFGAARRSVEIDVAAYELVDRTIVVPAGHLRVYAALTEGGDAVDARIDVLHGKPDLEGKRKVVKRKNSKAGKPAIFQLAEGDYFITAVYGKAERSFERQVEAGEISNETLIVPAGQLQLAAVLSEGGKPVEARFDVYHGKLSPDGKRRVVSRKNSKAGKLALFQLAEGNYVVAAHYGGMERVVDVEVTAGEFHDEAVLLGSGRLRLTALRSEGGKAIPAEFRIVAEERGIAGKPRVDRSLQSEPDAPLDTELPIGRYRVTARYGEAELAEEVEVRPGEETELNLALNIGQLSLATVMAEAGQQVDATMSVWATDDQDAGLRKISDMQGKADQSVRVELPAGKYVVKAGYGDVEVSGDVEVDAGLLTENVLVLNAGYLDVFGRRSEDGPPIEAGITIYDTDPDGDGKRAIVADGRSEDGETAEFVLAAGRYLVIADDGKTEMSAEFEVKPGERTEAGLVMPEED